MNDAWLAELREFIAIPSVSADPAHQDDLRRAAEWVRDFVQRTGGEAELVPKGTRDLVIGDIPANANGADAPTVMIYGHFDVQPPAPLDLWESPPFELQERDGMMAVFKGRGEVDGQQTVTAKITLGRYNLGDRDPAWKPMDERIVTSLRGLYAVLKGELQEVGG